MKRVFTFLLFFVFLGGINAQVFNSSSTLKRGKFSAGFEPGIYVNGDTDFNLFLHGGAGITSGVDLGLKLGVLGHTNYVGADVEFQFGKQFSLSTGAHSYGDFGLDITALYTFDLSKINIYTGLDLDIVFDDDVEFPLWLPIGVEVGLKSNMAFIFETSINLTDYGAHWIGGGLNFYF